MTIKSVSPYFVLLIIALLLYSGLSKLIERRLYNDVQRKMFVAPQQTGKENMALPSFKILLADSLTTLNTANIPSGSPIVLFYFSPYCPFCEKEMKEIIDNIPKLKGIQFYLLTPYSFNEMKIFNTRYNLEKYDNIKIGIDTQSSFGIYFNTVNTPFIAIYGKDKKLNGAFIGNINTEQILAISKI